MIEALYVHIPFCQAKCNYCDFLSFPDSTVELQKRYVDALKEEGLLKGKYLDINLKSMFFGGGTPTCLSGGLLPHLVEFFQSVFPTAQDVEISIEANPGTVERQKLELLAQRGVNRISFGVQSFNEQLLQRLGRTHTIEDVYRSYQEAHQVGIQNVNFDLMYGLPGQSLMDWERSLKILLELDLTHISLYQLKIAEETPFGNQLAQGIISEFDDGLALEMYKMAQVYLAKAGFFQYEIANFAKPGYKCRHNQVYWRTKPYLGLGVGAHSYLPPERVENLGEISAYLARLEQGEMPPVFKERQTKNSAMSETMFMGLRLLEGVNLAEFQNSFKEDPQQVFAKAIKKCLKLGLVEFNEGHLRLTAHGIYLGNLVFEEFLL